MYGLKQAGRNWNKLIHSVLTSAGFVRIDEDACVYIRHRGNGDVVLLLLYVDDILLAASNTDLLHEFVSFLRSHFKLKLLGVPIDVGLSRTQAPTQLLGLQLTWGEGFRSVHISAEKLVREVVRDFYESKSSEPKQVPICPNHRLTKADCIPVDRSNTAEVKRMQADYRSIVGVCVFLVTTCRLDISYAVSMLAQYMSKPGYAHYKAAQYLLSYLSGTTNLGIAYYSTGNRKPYAYADADFGADESRRARVGSVFMLAGGPIHWSSKLTEEIPLSTCESEIRSIGAAYGPTRYCVWLCRFMEDICYKEPGEPGRISIGLSPEVVLDGFDLSIDVDEPFVIWEDNRAAIDYAKNPSNSKRMRHLDRSLKWIRQEVGKGTVELRWIETKDQLADVFTKALAAGPFWSIVNRSMTYSR